MGFFARSKDWLKLRSKQAQLKKTPDPVILCELVQCHLRLGELENAFEHISWGLKRFPDSDVVQETHRVVIRERARTGIQLVAKEIQHNPTAESFLKLARFALQLRDSDSAGKALRECIKRLPDCAPAYALLAELHERRFARDLSAADGMAILGLAQKACRLDPTDLETQIRLARFLSTIGADFLARKLLVAVVSRDSRRQDARALLDQLGENPPLIKPEDLGDILTRIEEEGRLPNDGSEEYRIQREVGKLCRGLRDVKERLKARRAIVVNPDGESFDDLGPLGVDSFVELSRNLAASSQLLCRRTELGVLRGVTLEGAGGALVLRRGFRCALGCLLPKDGTILGSQEALRVLAETAGGGRELEAIS